ncbi:LysR family transcriptional regulator [Shewanella nanhaiensis]|uniref:LysR family transcriptional regulator n=1 Tax=Shewanella nanhaiensis TaxID=2864872 RepID=A0ABS7E8M4_9GAMM|nr:LysR family transcriptional regulator [Shewanella nanhaiensis]MBW8186015.1 LysR family transcriptional regulator [Shewanella nanhaiensis]
MNKLHNKLNRLDLNLLKLFSALYRERNVSVAAESMNLSQSAFSHALARLRVQLDDELFIRGSTQMVPTHYADNIYPQVTEALSILEDCFAARAKFIPEESRHEFNFAVTDFTAQLMNSRLLPYLKLHAPMVRVNLISRGEKLPLEAFESGELDFALGFSHFDDVLHPLINQWTWWEDSYCTIASDKFDKMDLQIFLSHRHILISPWGEKSGVVDEQLKKLGLQRDIALQIPNVLNGPFMVAGSELLLTLPKFAAQTMQAMLPITLFEPPFGMPKYQLKLFTYKPSEDTLENIWMRELLLSLFVSN